MEEALLQLSPRLGKAWELNHGWLVDTSSEWPVNERGAGGDLAVFFERVLSTLRGDAELRR